MKNLLKHILIFSIPFLVIWIGIEVFYRTTPNNYTYKEKQLKENYKNLETLVLGDSHALYAVNPVFFDQNTYNFAIISQPLYFDKLLFEKHIDSLPKLENLILTVGYTTLSQVDEELKLDWRRFIYSSQLGLDVSVNSKFDPKSYSLALTRRFKQTVKVISDYVKNETIITCDENGFGIDKPFDQSIELTRNSKIIARMHEDGLHDFSHSIERFQSIIDACKQRNINVFLVSYPVCKYYSEFVDQTKLKNIFETCEALDKKNENAIYLNMFNDERFEDSDFFDANHLDHLGAEKCSRILNKIIQ